MLQYQLVTCTLTALTRVFGAVPNRTMCVRDPWMVPPIMRRHAYHKFLQDSFHCLLRDSLLWTKHPINASSLECFRSVVVKWDLLLFSSCCQVLFETGILNE